MVGENIANLSDIQIGLTDILSPALIDQIDKLVLISKIAIYVIIGYVIFLIIKQFSGWRRHKRINTMYHKINNIDEKMNILLDIEKVKLKKERLSKEKSLKQIKKEEKKIKGKKRGLLDIFKRKKKFKKK